MRNDLLDVLWEPLALRGIVLPNRVMCSATTLQYGVDGLLGDRHVAFYRERARGGVGLIVSERAGSPRTTTAVIHEAESFARAL